MIDSFDGKYAFLSNFYTSPIEIDGLTFQTVEAAFQAAKTNDQSERIAIARASTPGQAKRLGRRVKLRPDWELVKDAAMFDCLLAKFSDPDLARRLLATGTRELVEGNTWCDNCWGNCICRKCCDIPGENRLGKALMHVRKILQDGQSIEKVRRFVVMYRFQITSLSQIKQETVL